MNKHITEIDDNSYEKYGIIKPPSTFTGDNQKYTRLVIDSRIRDKELFPNQNNYEIPLDDDINDVITAQLIYMNMPFTLYTVNVNFNTLVFTYDGTTYTLVLSTGNYDISTLQDEFRTQMNAILGLNQMTISYNSRRDSFKFTGNRPFTFKFNKQKNTLAYLLGFRENKDYTSVSIGGGQYELEAEFKCNFDYNNFVIMDIDQFDILKSIDSELNRTFAIIPKVYNSQNVIDNPQYIKRFSPPIGKLNKIRIRIYDRFGNDYDFQNQDHRFELLLTSFKQQRKYGNIFAA